jgi:hypothetical protein
MKTIFNFLPVINKLRKGPILVLTLLIIITSINAQVFRNLWVEGDSDQVAVVEQAVLHQF